MKLLTDFPKKKFIAYQTKFEELLILYSTDQTNPEFRRFFGMALRSGIEVIGCIYLAKERKIIKEEDFKRVYEGYEALIVSIQSLRKTL